MSVVARRCHTRYSFRMTELSPLEYAASFAPLIPILGMLAAWKSDDDFGTRLKRQGRTLILAPLALSLWILGKILGTVAWTGRHLTHWMYCLVELWAGESRIADVLYRWNERLLRYSLHGQFYRPQHAA